MATKEQIEGIMLIGDWCKWYAAIDTAAIAAMGALVKHDKSNPLLLCAKIPCVVAIVGFAASIVLAAWTLTSLPEAVQDIPERDTWTSDWFKRKDAIWNRKGILFGREVSFACLCHWQLASFFLGVLGFAIMVMAIAFE